MEVMQQAFFSDGLLHHVAGHMEHLAAKAAAAAAEASSRSTRDARNNRAGAERRLREELAKVKQECARHEEAARVAQEEMEGMEIRYEHELRVARIEGQGAARVWKERCKEEFEKRKKLTEEVLELKGNIRVFCRVRPLIAKEREAGEAVAVAARNSEHISVETGNGEREYEYDR